MASSKSRNNSNFAIGGSWKDWCIDIYDRVATDGCVASCMPLPTDGVVQEETELMSVTTLERPPRTIITTTTILIPMCRNKSEADKARQAQTHYLDEYGMTTDEEDHNTTKIDKLSSTDHDQWQPRLPQPVTQVAKRRVSASSSGDDNSCENFQNPFPLFPKPKDTTAAVPRDTRSIDNSVQSSMYTSASNIDNNLERELPSFGTHRSNSSYESSFGTSSYSQAYSPALTSYLYRCHERSLPDVQQQQQQHYDYKKTRSSFGMSLEAPLRSSSFSTELRHSYSTSTTAVTMPTGNPQSQSYWDSQ